MASVSGSYFCITAQTDAQARVESNYFENSSRPNRDTGGTVFTVPCTYTKDSAATARTQAMKCSGPQPIR